MPLVDGLPIGLQIVAWREQGIPLAATTEIDRVLGRQPTGRLRGQVVLPESCWTVLLQNVPEPKAR
jgi:hypothetical protein